MSTRSKDWELKDIKAKAPGDAKIHLRSTDDMLNWLDAFFPNSESQLCIIPHPSRIKRKNLFVQEKHKEDKTFDSEVVDVFGCLIESLPSGFAFYEYKTQQAKNTFSNVNPFEIDWILVNKSGICVVEVGEASDPKNPGSIINDKINQIRNKSRDVIEQVLKAASKGQFSDNVKYIVALPNVKTQQIRIWLSDKTSIALDRLWFFTVETLTTNEIYSGSKLEVAENLESFFRFGGEFDQALKLVASLICHGYHATCKRRTGGDNLLDAVENKLQLSKKDKERRDKQLGQIWNQLEFPEDLILSPQQLEAFKAIVSGEFDYFYLIGKAGTGKTTILQLLLIYYAGNRLQSPVGPRIFLFIPKTKWAFIRVMEQFINENCHQNMVQLCQDEFFSWFEENQESVLESIVLIDEDYVFGHFPGLILAERRSSIVNKGTKIVRSCIEGGSDMELIKMLRSSSITLWKEPKVPRFQRKTMYLNQNFRSAKHISKAAVRAMNNHETSFGPVKNLTVSFQSTMQAAVSFRKVKSFDDVLQSVKNNSKDALICIGEPQNHHYSSLNAKLSQNVYVLYDPYKPQNIEFSGIEVDSLIIFLSSKNEKNNFFPFGFSCLYHAISRARVSVELVSESTVVIELVKELLKPTELDTLVDTIMASKPVSVELFDKALFRCSSDSNDFPRRYLQKPMQAALRVLNEGNKNAIESLITLLENRCYPWQVVFASELTYSKCFVSSPHTFKYILGLFLKHRGSFSLRQCAEVFSCLTETWLSCHGVLDTATNTTFREMFEEITFSESDIHFELEPLELMQASQVSAQLGLKNCDAIYIKKLHERLMNRFHVSESFLLIAAFHNCFFFVRQLILDLNFPNFFDDSQSMNQMKRRPWNKSLLLVLLTHPNILPKLFTEEGEFLQFAAEDSSLEQMLEKLAKKLELNPKVLSIRDKNGFTLFDNWFLCGNEEAQKFVTSFDAHFLRKIDMRISVGYILSYLGQQEKLETFLINVPKEELFKETPSKENILTAACKSGQTHIVQFLKDSAEFCSIFLEKPSSGIWPVYYSCLNGSNNIVKLFVCDDLFLYSKSGNNQETLLHAAARGGWVEVANTILEKDTQKLLSRWLSKDKYSPLSIACRENNLKMIKLLYEADPTALILSENFNGNALFVAAKHAQATSVRYLWEESNTRAAQLFQGNRELSIFRISVKYSNLDTITQLCEEYADELINNLKEQKKLLKILLKRWDGGFILAYFQERVFHDSVLRSKFGKEEETLLHIAARAPHDFPYWDGSRLEGVLVCLLSRDAELKLTMMVSKQGYTPLSLACSLESSVSFDTVKKLFCANPEALRVNETFNGNALLVAAKSCDSLWKMRRLLDMSGSTVDQVEVIEGGEKTSVIQVLARTGLFSYPGLYEEFMYKSGERGMLTAWLSNPENYRYFYRTRFLALFPNLFYIQPNDYGILISPRGIALKLTWGAFRYCFLNVGRARDEWEYGETKEALTTSTFQELFLE